MKTQLLKHTAWSLILAFCFTQVMPVGLAVTNLNELPKGAGVSASRDARAAGSEKLEAESELANSPQRGNSMDFMVNDNPISSAASTTASVKHPGDVKNIELDPKTQPPGNNKNIELDPQVVSKPQSSVINPRVVQAYADALRKTGFQVKAEYVEAMHRYLVTVTDPRADSPALQGKLKYLSFTVNLDGSFKGVLQATYHGKTFNEAQLLFEAMLACPQGEACAGQGLTPVEAIREMRDLTAISFTWPATIIYMKNGVVYAAMGANGQVTVHRELSVEDQQMVLRVNDPKFNFDFNGDGKLDDADTLLYQSFDGETGTTPELADYLTPEARARLDLNKDGSVNAQDVAFYGMMVPMSEAKAKAYLLSQFPGMEADFIRVISVESLQGGRLSDGTVIPGGFLGAHLVTLQFGRDGLRLTFVGGINIQDGATMALPTKTTLEYFKQQAKTLQAYVDALRKTAQCFS